MDWWVLELMWFAGMVFLALWLGPFIRRFGKSYAADVFRANPRTGKSFIVLMDVAYYLIFFAFILFTVQVRTRRQLGPDGERQPAPRGHRAARRHPAHRRLAARAQRADAADHRPDPHAEPPPGRGHTAARATHQPELIRPHAPPALGPVCVRAAGRCRSSAWRESGRLPTRGVRGGAALPGAIGPMIGLLAGGGCLALAVIGSLAMVGLGSGDSDSDGDKSRTATHRSQPRRSERDKAGPASTTTSTTSVEVTRTARLGPEVTVEAEEGTTFPASYDVADGLVSGTVLRMRVRGFEPFAEAVAEQCTPSVSGRCDNQIPVQFDADGEAHFQYLISADIQDSRPVPDRCRAAGRAVHRRRARVGGRDPRCNPDDLRR